MCNRTWYRRPGLSSRKVSRQRLPSPTTASRIDDAPAPVSTAAPTNARAVVEAPRGADRIGSALVPASWPTPMAYVSNHMSTGTFGESSFGASGELSVASSELRQNVHPGGLWRCGSVEGLLTLAVVWTMLLRQEAGSSGELPVTCLYPRRALRWPRPMDIVLVSLPGGAWRSDEFGFHST